MADVGSRPGLFSSDSGSVPVVVVAMKAQLLGRIRRTVTTLLEEGATVTVLTVKSNKDFTVGLRHPNLRVELLEPTSVYLWFVHRQQSGRHWHQNALRALRALSRLFQRKFATNVQRSGRLAAQRIPRIKLGIRRVARRRQQALSVSPETASAFYSPAAAGPLAPSLFKRIIGPALHSVARHLRRIRLRIRRIGRRATRRLRRTRLQHRRRRIEWWRHRLLPLHRFTRFYSFWQLTQVRTQELTPALVLSSDLPGLVGANRAATALGVPHVHDCHELYLESTNFNALDRVLLRQIEKRYMRRASRIVFVNDSIRSEYGNRYGVSGVTVRNCVDTRYLEPGVDLRNSSAVPKRADILLYQGGFSAGRGLDVVVRAIASLPRHVYVVFMGYGPLKESLSGLARHLGVSSRIAFVDAVPPYQLVSTASSATIGIIPYQPLSQNNFYSLPNKLFEYTAAGLPVVASRIPEMTNLESTGAVFTYNPFDPEDLARAVHTLIKPNNLTAARAASREWAQKNSWAKERVQLVDCLMEVLANKEPDFEACSIA